MENLLFISLLGILVGAFSNLIPLLGSTTFNFLIAILLTTYQQLAVEVGFSLIPTPLLVFTIAYLFGTFIVKLLAILPTPLAPFFIGLRGTI